MMIAASMREYESANNANNETVHQKGMQEILVMLN